MAVGCRRAGSAEGVDPVGDDGKNREEGEEPDGRDEKGHVAGKRGSRL